jgi:hypothetical protein
MGKPAFSEKLFINGCDFSCFFRISLTLSTSIFPSLFSLKNFSIGFLELVAFFSSLKTSLLQLLKMRQENKIIIKDNLEGAKTVVCRKICFGSYILFC